MRKAWECYFSFYRRWVYWVTICVAPAIIIISKEITPDKYAVVLKHEYLIFYFLCLMLCERFGMHGILSYSKDKYAFFCTSSNGADYFRNVFAADLTVKTAVLLGLSFYVYDVGPKGIVAFTFVYILLLAASILIRYINVDNDGIQAAGIVIGVIVTNVFLVTAISDMYRGWPIFVGVAVLAGFGYYKACMRRMGEKYQWSKI
ncbi:MAG: hypothetical protein E7277_05755 [Lachnospiraceae bacterium]|nr:hypothetical protein [Lachnospiraceae bacterium]